MAVEICLRAPFYVCSVLMEQHNAESWSFEFVVIIPILLKSVAKLRNRDAEALFSAVNRFFELERDVNARFTLHFLKDIRVLVHIWVVGHADACTLEQSFVVVDVHEEEAIVFCPQTNFGLEGWCPFCRLIGPVSLPFASAPRISELK